MPDDLKEFPCKEPKCDQTVRYKPEKVLGIAQLTRKPDAFTDVEEDVYLTCSKGHTWPYPVTVRVRK